MTQSVSLTMLQQVAPPPESETAKKGSKGPKGSKAPATAPIPDFLKEPAPVEAQEPEAGIDIETMDTDDLDIFVAQQGIEVPPEFKAMTAEDKRAWLYENVGEEEPAADETGDEDVVNGEDEANEKMAQEAEAEVEGPPAQAVKQVSLPSNIAPPTPAKAKAKAKGSKAAKPPAKAKAGKKPAIVAVDAETGEILEPDELQNIVHTIENLSTEVSAKAALHDCAARSDLTFFQIGGILSRIQANAWYAPHANLREYITSECAPSITYHTGLIWIDIYNRLANSGVPWAKLKNVGWTKIQVLASVLTLKNVDEWVAHAEKYNTVTLSGMVKAAKLKNAMPTVTGDADPTIQSITNLKFVIHDDQKPAIEAALLKAKKDGGTDVASVALEYMAKDYLGGMTITEKLKSLGIEKTLEIIDKLWGKQFQIEVTPLDTSEDEAA